MSRFATLDTDDFSSNDNNNEVNDTEGTPALLKVVGVGGGGCNAIESMMRRGLGGVEYVAINTDAQVLQNSKATHKIQVGYNITRGLGAGADPKIGKSAIEEDRKNIEKVLKGSDMVFVTAGMGGGTGTGGAPSIASIAKSLGALVVGIVTKPFRWEGKKRMNNAEEGIKELRQHVDSLIVIPNERLLNILDKSVAASLAFDKPNEVLYEATRGIADIITITGIINVDFADVRAVMSQSGDALMGCGTAKGENRAVEAAQAAISSPLLEGINIQGAKNILLNVTGSDSLTMQEINEGNQVIYDAAGEEANVIFGWVNKAEMKDEVSYTVIATGFNNSSSGADSARQARQQEQQRTEQPQSPPVNNNFHSGFQVGKNNLTEEVDYDVPTIYRVKGSNDLSNKFSSTYDDPGFKTHKDEEEEKKNDRFNDFDQEEDSSSFLRKMMD